MATPSSEQIKVQLYAAIGDTLGSEDRVLNYVESSSTEGNRKVVIPKEYAASASNQSLDLSAFVDTATWIIVIDRGGVGVNIALGGSDTAFQLAGNGVFAYKNANATPPTLYFDNPSSTLKTFIDVIVLGSSS